MVKVTLQSLTDAHGRRLNKEIRACPIHLNSWAKIEEPAGPAENVLIEGKCGPIMLKSNQLKKIIIKGENKSG